MSRTAEPANSFDAELAEIQRLLATDPVLAAEKASRILESDPAHHVGTLYLGIAHRLAGDADASIGVLEPLVQAEPGWAVVHYEVGRSYGAAGRSEHAIAALRRAVDLQPGLPGAWNSLADQLRATGDNAGADAVCARRIELASRDPRIVRAGQALRENRIAEADGLLRQQLQHDPTDVVAMRLLADVGLRLGQHADAVVLLSRCLQLAPAFAAARHDYATALFRQMRPEDAKQQIELALQADPRNPNYRCLQAAILGWIGEFEDANEIYAGVLEEYPDQPRIWMTYGDALKAAGRRDDSIAAYRKSIGQSPGLGEAWWALADLKTYRFTAGEIDSIRGQLARTDLPDDDRLHFEFALGKVLEDAGDYGRSMDHYAEGNRLRRSTVRYDAADFTADVQRYKAFFTTDYFAERAGSGSHVAGPVFIVGLPRAGSTLLEQILSCHPEVEGTRELPYLLAIARELADRGNRQSARSYPEVLATLESAEFRELGECYLRSTQIHRKSGRPVFIDKMPNNFAHVGLIHLILPNARIVDARRHPLACCFSNFKQHFARGQHFAYSLDDVGRYYRDYVELMSHFDEVLPGRVHRVFYERLVDDTETEVRRLLDYCGLPFDERCLRFHESERAVRTASSEQVRQPVYRDGLDHWRHFERWLDPLKQALGPVLEFYPGVPGRTA